MIYLFTDFGSHDLYPGQVKARLQQGAPGASVIDLLNDAPNYDILHSAHLLSALCSTMDGKNVVMFCVVDPGVGGIRRALVLKADGKWLVGPDNGLLAVVAQRARECQFWEITWRPEVLSNSFHGRDLFAPIAAMLEMGNIWPGALTDIERLDVCDNGDDLYQLIYVDHYGNAMSGVRCGCIAHEEKLEISGVSLSYARSFCEVPVGTAFWYENSLGLIEIAVNQGDAAQEFGFEVGMEIKLIKQS